MFTILHFILTCSECSLKKMSLRSWMFSSVLFARLCLRDTKVCCFILPSSFLLSQLVDKKVLLFLEQNCNLHSCGVLHSASSLCCQNTFTSAWELFSLLASALFLCGEQPKWCQIGSRERFFMNNDTFKWD